MATGAGAGLSVRTPFTQTGSVRVFDPLFAVEVRGVVLRVVAEYALGTLQRVVLPVDVAYSV